MAEENFSDNLLRMIAAELALAASMTVAREMFSRGYFSLGVGEKAVVDQTVFAHLQANYQTITPQFLANQAQQQPMGFVYPAPTAPQAKT